MPEPTSSAIGPTGRTVIANIEDLRAKRGLSLRDLSALLGKAGRPIGDSVLHRQSQGGRRIDADDLVAFAAVLGVNPNALLFPRDTAYDDVLELTPDIRQRAYLVWLWANGRSPLPAEIAPAGATDVIVSLPRLADFIEHAYPRGGDLRGGEALVEAYNFAGRMELASKDYANPVTWDRRRDALLRAYQTLGAVLEEFIATGDEESARGRL